MKYGLFLYLPNHYALVTGLLPSHNGLTGNSFYDTGSGKNYRYSDRKKYLDKTWYGGTPIWVLAEQQKMLSATYYWIGSDAGIKNVYPTYYYNYNEVTGIRERISTVVNWLKLPAEDRPHFITFYLPHADKNGHAFGPESIETKQAVKLIDLAVNELTGAVKTTGLDVNFIFVSDHGMIEADYKNPIDIQAVVDTTNYKVYGDASMIQLYAKPGADMVPDYNKLKSNATGYNVYLKTNIPRHYHFNAKDDLYGRIGDILLMAKSPKMFKFGNYKVNPGQHGYEAEEVPEMRAVFYAWGPAFKKNTIIKPFKNVSIYNLVNKILGLTFTEKVDGNDELAKKVLLINSLK
ncbi:MAG: alkaline phosphatase family protein [Sphingobacteriaceae bacterium]|nr:MAG: alkaline phosphatase family protein [Sphingobacteriaceae bacterium]